VIWEKPDLMKLQLAVKWLVYLLLVVNFGAYIDEDWHAMMYGMPDNPTLLDWAGNFATTLDVLAWLALLGLFEYETWFMSDSASSLEVYITKAARAVCYLVLAHTFYAYTQNYADLIAAVPLPAAADLCGMAEAGASFLWDLVYTEIDATNCGALGQGPEWFQLYNESVITDANGLAREKFLAISDLLEIICWFGIMGLLELDVVLQERKITSGALLRNGQRIKLFLYLGLIGLSVYWVSIGHWLYAWDEFLWIAGFAAIEMNLSEWRDEINEEADTPVLVE
jgi:hypothetical protein